MIKKSLTLTNKEYILAHKDEDIRSLALRQVPAGVNSSYCLTQIEGYQLAKKKLPHWAEIEGIIYPPRLSLEQCSSELTAEYKADLVKRLLGKYRLKHLPQGEDVRGSFVDLTGGFGVDFSYMAKGCDKAIYVERQEVLCAIARNNIPFLGLHNAEIINSSCEEYLLKLSPLCRKDAEGATVIIYIDPARRDDCGRKVATIEDCTPNLIEIQDTLLSKADYVIVKLSPMLDITQALRTLHHVIEVHVVSVKNECKELLVILSASSSQPPTITYHCINLGTSEAPFTSVLNSGSAHGNSTVMLSLPEEGMLLIEPNPSIMKAGAQDAFAARYGLMKLHPMSHLYTGATDTGNQVLQDIPGRIFSIKEVLDFSKTSLKHLRSDVKQANLTIRNFPSTVAALRKRLKLKEGGSEYLFATTLMDNSHALIRCENLRKK